MVYWAHLQDIGSHRALFYGILGSFVARCRAHGEKE